MLEKITKEKTVAVNDLLTSGQRRYERTARGRVRNYCRLSLRQKQTLLVVLLAEDVAKQAGIGETVELFFDTKTLTLVATDDGAFTVRKQSSDSHTYPYLLVPIGDDRPFSCKIDGTGSVKCVHHIDEVGRLVLSLPELVHLTCNDKKQAA